MATSKSALVSQPRSGARAGAARGGHIPPAPPAAAGNGSGGKGTYSGHRLGVATSSGRSRPSRGPRRPGPAGTPRPNRPAPAASPRGTGSPATPPTYPPPPPPGGGRDTDIDLGVPSLPGKTYHRIVLAEFAACVVLVGLSPVLTPRTKGKGDQTVVDTTASLAGPLVRLTAVCAVYFVLALMANGPRTGKVAAAFGGLVLVGALLNATDMLTAIAETFAPAKPAGKLSEASGGPVNPGGGVSEVSGGPVNPGALLGSAAGEVAGAAG